VESVFSALVLCALQEREPGSKPAREAALAQCSDCHAALVESFEGTGMARALEPLRPGEFAGFAAVEEAGTGFVYAFEGEDKNARLVETRTEGTWRDSLALAFAIGAGELDRSFVVTRGKRLWLAPLEILGHGSERHAGLAPGHTIQPGSRFTSPITPECLGCHTDAPPPRAWPLNLAPAEWVPRGISCAACHGALEQHVASQAAELAGGPALAADPLGREREWSRVQRMERCAACHLQGDARIELEPGRVGPPPPGPPPPGTPLLATRAVFVAREPGDEIGFVSHVQRLVLSRCYLESARFPGGGLACETCHDPHRSVHEPEERARVRAACQACHEPAGAAAQRAADCALPRGERPAERDCADCHMRRTGVFDVAEVEIHDHRIARRPGAPSPRRALRFSESASGDWRVFEWPDAPAPERAEDPGPWTMALFHGGHTERALEYLRRGEGTRAKDLAMLHHVRGSLLEGAGEYSAARAAYQRALELDPELAEAAINLAPVLAQEGAAQQGKELLDALIRRHPFADTAYRNRATVRLALDDDMGFRADLEAALKLLPDAALAQAFARYLAQRGDTAGEQRWLQEARWLDPRVP
jgi:tetratricopeptide (TPR) repeat protein